MTLHPLTLTTCLLDANQEQCIPDTEETNTIEAQWTATGEPQIVYSFEEKSKTVSEDQKVSIKTSSEYALVDATATRSVDNLEFGETSLANIASSDSLYFERSIRSKTAIIIAAGVKTKREIIFLSSFLPYNFMFEFFVSTFFKSFISPTRLSFKKDLLKYWQV
jgi:hypothetical protein